MTSTGPSRRIEINHDGRTVAAAEVGAAEADGTARASLQATSGHVSPGTRADLIDAVMDSPEVQASARLEAAVPLGDGEALERLRERTDDIVIRPAGSTALVEATLPPADQPEASHESGEHASGG